MARPEQRQAFAMPTALNVGEHRTACGIAKQIGYRFCEGCMKTKPKNSRPLVKGWLCNDCYKSRGG